MLNTRQKKILDILQEKGRVKISELASRLYVSEMTIRRDLGEMEHEGILERYRGGAVLLSDSGKLPISRRFFTEEDEKRSLSQKAVKYLKNGLNIFIDSSSTCAYIVYRLVEFKNITVFTNSLNTLQLLHRMHIPCTLIGGDYDEHDMCFTGNIARCVADMINVDVAFFSSLGICDDIISDPSLEQTEIKRIIMSHSEKNVFLFEKNRVGQKYLYTLCKTNAATDIIIS